MSNTDTSSGAPAGMVVLCGGTSNECSYCTEAAVDGLSLGRIDAAGGLFYRGTIFGLEYQR